MHCMACLQQLQAIHVLTRSGLCLHTIEKAANSATMVVQMDVTYDWPTSLLRGMRCTVTSAFCQQHPQHRPQRTRA